MLLAERSDDLEGLFKPGEADFFGSAEELVSKLDRYLMDDKLRERIARAGTRRVLADGHDVVSRMRDVMAWVAELQG
jgi:spore maturation protein CgeB